MTVASFDHSRSATGSLPEVMKQSLDRVRDAYGRHAAYTKAVRQLSAMSDRDLADIGIRRGDIRDVALGASTRTIA